MRLHSMGYLFKEGVKGLWKNRTMSIASICVLISCLLMTGIAGLLSINLSASMRGIEANNNITVFLDKNLPALTAVKVGEELRRVDNISECSFMPRDDGLKNVIQSIGGGGDLLLALQGDDNPLPDVYSISMKDLSRYQETIAQLEAVEGVDYASDYSYIANQLNSLDRLVRNCSLGILVNIELHHFGFTRQKFFYLLNYRRHTPAMRAPCREKFHQNHTFRACKIVVIHSNPIFNQ